MMIRPADSDRGNLNVAPASPESGTSPFEEESVERSVGGGGGVVSSTRRSAALDRIASGLLSGRVVAGSFRKKSKALDASSWSPSKKGDGGASTAETKTAGEPELGLSDLKPEDGEERRNNDDCASFHTSAPSLFFRMAGESSENFGDDDEDDDDDGPIAAPVRREEGRPRLLRRGSGVSLPGRTTGGGGGARRRGSGVSLTGGLGLGLTGILKKAPKYSSNNLVELGRGQQQEKAEAAAEEGEQRQRNGRADRRGSGVSMASIRSVQFADEVYDEDDSDDELSLGDLLGALDGGGDDECDEGVVVPGDNGPHKSKNGSIGNGSSRTIEFDLGAFREEEEDENDSETRDGSKKNGNKDSHNHGSNGSGGSWGWGNGSSELPGNAGMDWAERLPDMMAFSSGAPVPPAPPADEIETPRTANRKKPTKKKSEDAREQELGIADLEGNEDDDEAPPSGIPRELSFGDLTKEKGGCSPAAAFPEWGHKSSASCLTFEGPVTSLLREDDGEEEVEEQGAPLPKKDREGGAAASAVPRELDLDALAGPSSTAPAAERRTSACSWGDKSAASGLTLDFEEDDEDEGDEPVPFQLRNASERRPSAVSWGDKSAASGLTLDDETLASLLREGGDDDGDEEGKEKDRAAPPRELGLDDLEPVAPQWGHKSSASGLSFEGSFSLLEE